jgi:hypothetical protein
MVDYSKWDSFDGGSSDEEVDSKPHVTTLPTASKITIGPQGCTLGNEQEIESKLRDKLLKRKDQRVNNGGEVVRDDCRFYWTQDRYAVTLSIFINDNVRAKDIRVTLERKQLIIDDIITKSCILSGIMQYDVQLTNEADNPYDSICDWEIVKECAGNKILQLTLVKKSPIPGTSFWWKNVFVGDPEIDVTQIVGRSNSDLEASKNFAEAHHLFQQKIADMQKVDVNFDEET